MTFENDSRTSRWIALARSAPDLTREEEADLARRWRDGGDRGAADRVARACLRHVVAIARGYRGYGVPLADLISEGNLGVARALRRYDPDRGCRFVTYAAFWIRAQILTHVIDAWSLVGVGSGPLRSRLFFRLRRERARVEELRAAGDAGDRVLEAEYGMPAGRVEEMSRRLDARDVSLDAVREDGWGTMLDDLVAEGPDQEERLGEAEDLAALRGRLAGAIASLDPRERRVVEARLMACPEDELSLAEIGREMRVSRERARQLEMRARRKLRDRLGPVEGRGGSEPSAQPAARRARRRVRGRAGEFAVRRDEPG